jgi:uncharacterized protein (TIGR04255 family)
MKMDPVASARGRLPNSPLAEVVFEIRFPGHFSVLAGLGRFQDSISSEFGSLFVPRLEAGEPIALKPFRWTSADGLHSVHAALHLFSFTSKKYTVFDEFKSHAHGYLTRFFAVYRPPKLTRLGLRYINLLPLDRAHQRSDALHPWLNLGLSVPSVLQTKVDDLQCSALLSFQSGMLRVTLGTAVPNRPQEKDSHSPRETFALDFDFFRAGVIPVDSIDEFLDSGHQIIEDAFFSLIKADALQTLEGKP